MAEPSTDLLGSVIGQLAQHPELLRGVLGMLGGGPGPAVTPTEGAKEDAALPDAPDEEGAEAERRPAGAADAAQAAAVTRSAALARSGNREILAALKPYLRGRRRDVAERILRTYDLVELLRQTGK